MKFFFGIVLLISVLPFFSSSTAHAHPMAELKLGAWQTNMTIPLKDHFFDLRLPGKSTGFISLWSGQDPHFKAQLTFSQRDADQKPELCQPAQTGLGKAEDDHSAYWLPASVQPKPCGQLGTHWVNGLPPQMIIDGKMLWQKNSASPQLHIAFSGNKKLWHLHRSVLTSILQSMASTNSGQNYLYHHGLNLRLTLPGPEWLLQVQKNDIKLLFQKNHEQHTGSLIIKKLPKNEVFALQSVTQWVLDQHRMRATKVRLVSSPREQIQGKNLKSIYFVCESDLGDGLLRHREYVVQHGKNVLHIELSTPLKHDAHLQPKLQSILNEIVFREN